MPTRLRSSIPNASITGVPNLFKPRRKLVLMKDEQCTSDHKLGRKEVVSPGKNDTKPYAGEGGIKKMLAKRKLELEEGESRPEDVEEENKESKLASIEDKMQPSVSVQEVPPPLNDDWYSLASGSSGSNEVSSLRVGRAKRSHIARPTARPRAKFSAAFEDDGDDAMADQEKEMLEEAAKQAPVFNIPAGFTFANNVGQFYFSFETNHTYRSYRRSRLSTTPATRRSHLSNHFRSHYRRCRRLPNRRPLFLNPRLHYSEVRLLQRRLRPCLETRPLQLLQRNPWHFLVIRLQHHQLNHRENPVLTVFQTFSLDRKLSLSLSR